NLVAFVTDKAHGIGIVGNTKVVVRLYTAARYLVSILVKEFDSEISFVDMQAQIPGFQPIAQCIFNKINLAAFVADIVGDHRGERFIKGFFLLQADTTDVIPWNIDT